MSVPRSTSRRRCINQPPRPPHQAPPEHRRERRSDGARLLEAVFKSNRDVLVLKIEVTEAPDHAFTLRVMPRWQPMHTMRSGRSGKERR